MDPLGHASIGFIVKPLAPKAPLWALVAANELPDILFFGLQAAGVERLAVTQLDFAHGLRYLSLPSIAWSHGLVMCLVWSALAAGVAFIFSRDRRLSGLIGLMVFSHWVLDAIVYPVMPVFFDNSLLIGLGLMTSAPGFMASIVLEVALLAGGLAAFWVTRRRAAAQARG